MRLRKLIFDYFCGFVKIHGHPVPFISPKPQKSSKINFLGCIRFRKDPPFRWYICFFCKLTKTKSTHPVHFLWWPIIKFEMCFDFSSCEFLQVDNYFIPQYFGIRPWELHWMVYNNPLITQVQWCDFNIVYSNVRGSNFPLYQVFEENQYEVAKYSETEMDFLIFSGRPIHFLHIESTILMREFWG